MTASKPRERSRRPTLKMVAERAGVSTATVSYVLSGRGGGLSAASAATVERVRSAAQEIGYRPNPAARTVRTGRSNLVLLSLTMLADPWSQAVGQEVSARARQAGLRTLILADDDWADLLAGQPCEVAFIDDVEPHDVPALDGLAAHGQRLVVFAEELEADGYDVIRSPALPGCALVMDHLLATHRRIGCLSSGTADEPSVRLGPYRDAMAGAGLEVGPEDVQYFDRDPVSAYEAALRLLDRPDRPTAIYAITDFAAIAAIHAAQRLGLAVPGDVAVAGVGNTRDAERGHPTVTSVGPDDLFETLADLIVAIAQDPDGTPPRVHDFEWTLHCRESTAAEQARTQNESITRMRTSR